MLEILSPTLGRQAVVGRRPVHRHRRAARGLVRGGAPVHRPRPAAAVGRRVVRGLRRRLGRRLPDQPPARLPRHAGPGHRRRLRRWSCRTTGGTGRRSSCPSCTCCWPRPWSCWRTRCGRTARGCTGASTRCSSSPCALPVVAGTLYVFGFEPAPGFNPTTAVISVSGAIMAYALFRYRLFDIAPLARGMVVDGLSDGVIVLGHLRPHRRLQPGRAAPLPGPRPRGARAAGVRGARVPSGPAREHRPGGRRRAARPGHGGRRAVDDAARRRDRRRPARVAALHAGAHRRPQPRPAGCSATPCCCTT